MDRNPFNICTHDPDSLCDDCKLVGKIDCKLDVNLQKTSMKTVFSFVIIAISGLIVNGLVTGMWWFLVVYIIFIVLFFFVIEVRINCSHCPYYAENKKRLNCPGNNFFPKIWRFNSKPITPIEKAGTILGFVFIGIFPIIAELYSIWFIFSSGLSLNVFSVLGLVVFLFVTIIFYLFFILLFIFKFCPRCINFSCYFNKVPKEFVDEYLRRNPCLGCGHGKRLDKT